MFHIVSYDFRLILVIADMRERGETWDDLMVGGVTNTLEIKMLFRPDYQIFVSHIAFSRRIRYDSDTLFFIGRLFYVQSTLCPCRAAGAGHPYKQ